MKSAPTLRVTQLLASRSAWPNAWSPLRRRGVMLSEFTAQLVVENAVVQAEPGSAHIENVGSPVHAWRLLAVGEHQPVGATSRRWWVAYGNSTPSPPSSTRQGWYRVCRQCDGARDAASRFDGKASSPGTGLGATQEGPGSGLRMMRGGRRRPSRRMTGKPGGATLNDCWNQVAGFGGRRP